MPVDTAVVLNITSTDVIHSWSVPALGGQVQATPGDISQTWFKADEVGRYAGRSTIFSGTGYPAMSAWVRVVDRARVRGLHRAARRGPRRSPGHRPGRRISRRGPLTPPDARPRRRRHTAPPVPRSSPAACRKPRAAWIERATERRPQDRRPALHRHRLRLPRPRRGRVRADAPAADRAREHPDPARDLQPAADRVRLEFVVLFASRSRSGSSPTSCRCRSAPAGVALPRLGQLSYWLYAIGSGHDLRQLPLHRPRDRQRRAAAALRASLLTVQRRRRLDRRDRARVPRLHLLRDQPRGHAAAPARPGSRLAPDAAVQLGRRGGQLHADRDRPDDDRGADDAR